MESNTFQLNLPASLGDFVRAETVQGAFGSPEEYVTTLVAQAQRRKLMEQLEDMALEGVNSGSIEATPEFWDEQRRRIIEKHGAGEPS